MTAPSVLDFDAPAGKAVCRCATDEFPGPVVLKVLPTGEDPCIAFPEDVWLVIFPTEGDPCTVFTGSVWLGIFPTIKGDPFTGPPESDPVKDPTDAGIGVTLPLGRLLPCPVNAGLATAGFGISVPVCWKDC